MDTNRWKIVQEIFEKIVDRNISDRDALLQELCGDDEELKKEVLSLIESDKENLSLLEKPASNLVDFEKLNSLEGETIGQYKIVSQIGYGGMGEVYLAERIDEQFKQQVALKIIKKGMDSKEIVYRFQTERQILAKLKHPHIASLFDGGITDDGLPYFTMEYIEGHPIDRYCDMHKLSIKERIELFLHVVDAVEFAHKNFIVHRDLKPSNIIVNNEGKVKLLDFGIAKLLSENDFEEEVTNKTQTGMRVMTPGYASPEQVKGEIVTTSSDVYSLGVLLYELLSGQSPYDIKGKTPGEYEQIICQTNPPKPSTTLYKIHHNQSSDLSFKQISSQRSIKPDGLQKVLQGDLDNICLKALEKEPERRYNSAEQFSADIKRYLKGHPVKARPATIGYRTSKFISRHKAVMFSSVVVIITLVTLISFYTIQLSNERDKAQLEAEKAKQVSDYLISIFEIANPSESKGETITARQIVDEGVIRLDEELIDQPIIQAEMFTVLSDVYYSLGLLKKSKELAQKSLQLLQEYDSENIIAISEVYHDLGDVIYDLGEYKLSDTMYREALRLKREVLPGNDTLIALELISLATLSRLENNFENSRDLYEEALRIQLASMEKPHLELAYTMNNLGRLYQNNDMREKAEPLLLESLQMRRELLGDENFEVVASMGSLASFYYRSDDMKELEKAEKLYSDALQILLKIAGEDHHYTGGIMQSLANVESKLKKYDSAKEHYLKSYDILKKNLPEDHVNIAFPLAGLGRMLVMTDNAAEALDYLYEGYRLRLLSLPEGNWMIGYITTYIGRGHFLLEEYDKAEKYLLLTYDIFFENYGDDDFHTQEVIGYLVDLYQKLDNQAKLAVYKAKLKP